MSRPLWSVGLSSLLCRSWFPSLKKVVLIKEKRQQRHPPTETTLHYCLFGPLPVFCQISWSRFQILGLCLDVWSWFDRLQDSSYQETRASEISRVLWCTTNVINIIQSKCVGWRRLICVSLEWFKNGFSGSGDCNEMSLGFSKCAEIQLPSHDAFEVFSQNQALK